jgi:photosystem II stability/assembly factor-like uncharacterized protein
MLRRIVLATATALAFASGCHEVHFEPRVVSGEIGVFDDLFSVAVVDPDRAIAVGYFGAIYTTEDGGETWTKRESGTERSFYGVSMGDAQRGWAVGQTGLIARTEDGGVSWTQQPNLKVDEGVHLAAVHAIDGDTAWVVGAWGTRLYTEDGGGSWEDRSLTIDPQHPQFVWLVPQEQEKVRSGGKVYEDAGLNDVYCLPAPSQRCWIVGEFGYIFYSDDGGQTWERGTAKVDIQMDPIAFAFDKLDPDPAIEAPLRDLVAQIADQQHLKLEIEPVVSRRELAAFVVGGKPDELFDIIEARMAGIRTIVEDAGLLSDRIRVVGSPPWDYEDFEEFDDQFLQRYLEGRTARASAVWVRVAQNPYLFTVRFGDKDFGITSSLGGLVMRSSDGGRTWEGVQASSVKQAFFSVAIDASRSLAVGEKGLVRESADAGVSWAAPGDGFPPIFTFMRDVDFAPGKRVGFIVGQEGLVLRSRDGGASWERVLGREI